jgi:tetratricopeptide (TPR) repeat protein
MRLEESMVICRELGYQRGLSILLCNLGRAADLQGHHSRALALFDEGLAIQRPLGDRGTIANITHSLGVSLCSHGDYSRARAMLKEALAIWDELANPGGLVASLEEFACMAACQAQPALAARWWGRAERMREQMGSAQAPSTQARVKLYVAAACTDMGADAFDAAWAEGRAMPLDQVAREMLQS